MENQTMFKNAGEPWSLEEDNLLNKLYNEYRADIMEISIIHNRAPGVIISRLLKHNYITNRQSARGYLTYKNSDLYKSIVASNIHNKQNKINTPIDNILITIHKSDYTELQNDVKEMKNEIKELKNTIKGLVEMMKIVYEFENT